MWKNVLDYFIFLIVFIGNVNPLKISQINNPAHHLSDLVSNKHNKPLVVLLDTSKPEHSRDFDDLASGSVDGLVEDIYDTEANEDAAYILYHLLRTSKIEDGSDPILKGTKESLRQALRSRCSRVDDCVQKCPPKKPYCPIDCKQVFDNLNLCPPSRPPRPKKEKDCRPKCGKTMPPTWRFKF